jgi:hypothetical protein
VVPKHRRSEIESLLPSAGVNTADYLPEAVGYGQATATAWPAGSHSRVGHSANGYPASNDYDGYPPANGYDGYPPANGYDGAAAEPGWAAPEGQSWQDWQDWQDWGPPPAMHPDHPSAPVPRVQFPADHPSAPMPVTRDPGLPQRRPGGSARTWKPPSEPSDAGYGNGNRRLYAVPDDASAVDYPATAPSPPEDRGGRYSGQRAADFAGPDWQEPTGFQRQPGPGPREATGYQRQSGSGPREASGYQRQPGPARRNAPGNQRQAGPGRQETTDYRRETGQFGPGPTTGRFKDFRSPNRDSLRASGQVLEIHHGQGGEDQVALADGRGGQFTREAEDYAAAIREAAERDAAAITREASSRADTITQEATGQAAALREAMEREAAELRARLDSMTGELGRVAAYVTQNLAPSAMPGTAPAVPDVMPAFPETSPAQPQTRPARPDARPARPQTAPRTGPAGPQAAPRTRPAGPDAWAQPGTRPARPDTRPGRPDGPPKPRTTPARPSTTPTKMPQTQGRQRRAMLIATAGTAALLSVAAIGAVTMTSLHGFSFFVFRESGQGETPGTFTDANFLAGQKECFVSGVAADGTPNGSSDRIPAPCATAPTVQHHDSAPKGRHHKATASK